MKRSLGIVSAVWMAFAVAGCATTQTTKTTSAAPAPTAVQKTHTKASVGKGGNFTVEKGQTLWSIAHSEAGYGKSCNWPVIYKANKSLVQDPDLIYPGQKLVLPKNVPAVESDKACEAAAKFGPYQPHTTPRTDVNLDF